MYIIIKLLSYYYYFIIIFFPHERRGLHDPILVLINSISSSSSSYIYYFIYLDRNTRVTPMGAVYCRYRISHNKCVYKRSGLCSLATLIINKDNRTYVTIGFMAITGIGRPRAV